jgi:site-specific DNA-methyltransferase (adenine-specific)
MGGNVLEACTLGDALTLARQLPADSVDLLITDPPYGIQGDTLHKHYNRNEAFVLDGYAEVPAADYPAFTRSWIEQAARVLRPGGSAFIVSGYSMLMPILSSLQEAGLHEVNHIIWKYNFGVSTQRKFVSSHYHILYYEKKGGRRTFNQFSRFGSKDRKSAKGGSALYADLEDVWIINREYKPGQVKNKNQLPYSLLTKLIQYGSNPGDLVFDFFLGSFSTAIAAKGLNRRYGGFEVNQSAFRHGAKALAQAENGWLEATVPTGRDDRPARFGEPLSDSESAGILRLVAGRQKKGHTKKEAIAQAMEDYGRGYWSIEKLLKRARLGN